MNSLFRFLLGAVLALAAGASAHAAAVLDITGVAPSAASVQPGQSVQFTVTITNSALAPTGGGTSNDFSGGTADMAITLTSLTADPINLGSQAVSIPSITAAGTGTVIVSFTIPTKYSQAASYYITAEMGFRPTTSATGTATINGAVTAINMVNGSGVVSMGSNYSAAPTVNISGGGGLGAQARAIVAGGAVIAVDLITGGSGYTSTPSISFTNHPSDVTGSGAAATAAITGTVTGVTVNSVGAGYSSAPRIKFTGGAGGNYASANSSLAGSGVSAISVTSTGSGFTSAPTVTISGGGGSGATANASITGTVNTITLGASGTGYSPSTSVAFLGGGGSGATGTAVINGSVTAISVDAAGTGYTSAPTVTITGGGGAGATATASVAGGSITGITVNTAGTGYTSAPTITLSGGGGGTGGAATATVKGPITSLGISASGTGYTSAPTVSISDPGGSGATATATITAVLNTISITASGSGYTSAPTVTVSGGGGTGGAGAASINSNLSASVTISGGGASYAVAPSVVFIGGGPTVTGNGQISVSSYTTATTALTVTGQPDFIITGVNYPAGVAYKGGDVIPMSLTYTNLQASNGTQNVPFRPGNGINYFRIQVVISSNPTYGDADDFLLTFLDVPTTLNADNLPHTFSWNQLLPGNYSGSYYVLARIDSLKQVSESVENDPAQNGNNDWLDVAGTRIALLPTTFPTMYMASTGTTGNSGNGYSDNPSISSDGRYTVFASDASNLVSTTSAGGADTNNVRDIFIYDSQTGTTRRLNLSRQGAQANGNSNTPAISSDGRYVAFSSDATNLILGDNNGFTDIFVVDAITGTISLESVATNPSAGVLGVQGNGSSFKPSLSSDGRYLVFESSATNLVTPATTVGVTHIYLRDRTTGTTTLVSRANGASGTPGDGNSIQGVISADGAYVAFASSATNLVAGDTNGLRDVFLRNIAAGTTIRVSVGPAGVQSVTSPIGGDSRAPSISQDGRYIAFSSEAQNLVVGDNNGASDIFVYDRVAATTSRVSVSTAGTEATDPAGNPFLLGSINPNISATGRFVTFASMASNLTPGDTVGRYGTLAAATVAGGAVTAVNITNPGVASGSAYYTSLPGVTLAGGGGSGAAVTATLSNGTSGYITGFTVNSGGAGYTTAPSVTINGSFNGALNIYVADRDVSASGTYGTPGNIATTLVSVNKFGYQTVRILGVQSTAASDIYPVISADGRWVAMPSDAETNVGLATTTTNLLSNDNNGARDVFLHDRRINALPPASSPPVVTITSPGNGGSALVNTAIPITASATAARDSTGTIIGVVSSVQFFVNGTSVGTTSTFPYTATWTPTAVGSYTLSALVTDSFGNLGVSSNVVVSINAAPSVGLTSPAAGTQVTLGNVVSLTATAGASNPGGTVTLVEFFANDVLIGSDTSAPFGVSWTPTAAGPYSLKVRATETIGGVTTQTTSAVVAITVATAGTGGGGGGSTTPPIVSLSPLPPATTSMNARITLSANAAPGSSTTSITSVSFYAGSSLIGTATSAPYTAVWVPGALGTFSITAVATDNTGASTTSTAATVNVNGTLSVTLVSPVAGVTLPVNTPTTVSATATASNGTIVNVRFLANDQVIGTATSFPYTINWTPATAGVFSLLAVATDNTGAQTNSAIQTITVGTGIPPVVAVASPIAGSTLAVGTAQTIVANATAGSGTIVSVQFFANGASLGTDTTFPYNQPWTPAGAGTVDLTAVATDSLGNRTTSSVVTVTVASVSPGAPAVNITSPAAGSSLVVGTNTTVTATATDSDGTIAKVEFYANGVLLGSDSSYPYSVSFTPAATGNYTLTAVATDNGGNVTTSAAVGVTVSGGTAPSVAIVAPAIGSVLDVNVPQNILATASSTSGVVASVEFLVNGVSLSTKNAFPYSASWTPTAPGAYSLAARATDNFGNVTLSAPIAVTVTAGSPNLPTVALTSTPNGTSVTVNSGVFISADARDPDGAVTNVEFYVNDRLVGSRNSAPYYASWVPSAVGSYTIKATVTDDAGNRVTSAPATINATAQVGALPLTNLVFNNPAIDVVANPPAVDPLAPVKVDYGSKLIIRAVAVKDDGAITNVQFFANGVSIGSLTAAPYFTTWQLSTLSDVVLIALVTDSAGNSVFTRPILIDTIPSLGAASAAVKLVSPLDGSTYVNGGQIVFSATHNFGTVTPPKIDFYVNGSQFTTVTTSTGGGASSPYQYIVGLTLAGNYVIHAVGRQDNTTTVSAPARITVTNSRAPSIAITSPAVGNTYTVGTGLTIAANAASTTGLIQNVQFYVNGAALSSKNTTPYTAAWNPGAAGTYTLTAIATDDSGNQTISAPVVLTLVANSAPSVSITTPSTGSNTNAGSIVNLVAAAADSDGTVASVRFLANGNAVGSSATTAPFTTAWTPTAPGTYTVIAQATDNSGNVTNSAPISIVVSGNRAPIVAVTTPSNGSVVRSGSSFSISASASDADGTIASVQFFANGVSIGAPVTALPYRVQWTPSAEGVFRITAIAIDNAGAATTSTVLTVLVVDAASGATDSVYTGDYSGNGEAGRFAAITVRGKTAAFIAYSTLGATKTYFFPGLAVDGSGSFTAVDSLGRTALSARGSDTGITGTLDNGRIVAIGINTGLFPATRNVATGYYTGGLAGRPASTLAAIVGADGSITVYVADGTLQVAGAGSVDAQGNFTINGTSNARLTGKADPATGFLTGTLTGPANLGFSGAVSSGVSFSDGFLRNLSTRGQVGTGSNILIAGFVVGGSTAKQVLIRAIGPTLANFGLTGVLADPQLQIFNSSGAMITSNNNWSGSGEVSSASATVGAFPLASNSLDAALVASLAPGAYTAQVSGVGNGTGIALVEIYDVDTLTPFSSQKVINVATRGVAGQDDRQLIAGFVVNGNTAKKVLVRAVGPTLAAAPFNLAGVLVDPVLRIVRSDNVVIRENDNWEAGNDAALVTDAASRIGAFPLAAGSKDAAILINLPPGIYSAQAFGAGTSTGVALIEVYEIP